MKDSVVLVLVAFGIATKPSLEEACKQTVVSLKQSLNAAPYNCGF